MKKLLLLVLVSLLVIFSCYAEEYKFLGIPFDSSMQEVRSTMESKGWTYSKKQSKDSKLFFSGKTYAGKDVRNVTMSFKDNELKGITIGFKDRFDAQEVFKAMVDKYGLIELESRDILYKSSDDKNLFSLYINGSFIYIIITGGETKSSSENSLDESEI